MTPAACFRVWALPALLAGAVLVPLSTASSPAGRPQQFVERPDGYLERDPPVFRCVLDGRPRMVVIALNDAVWIAYDASTCTLYGAWRGDANLQGAVYDTTHGPQPETAGTFLLASHRTPGGLAEATWRARRAPSGEPIQVRVEFGGYRLRRGMFPELELHWEVALPDGTVVTVKEMPIADSEVLSQGFLTPKNGALVQRIFEVSDLPDGVTIEVPVGIWVHSEGDVWTGAPSRIGGIAFPGIEDPGCCRWADADAVEAFFEMGKAHALEVARRGSAREADAPGNWSPSYIALECDGVTVLDAGLYPLDELLEEDVEEDE